MIIDKKRDRIIKAPLLMAFIIFCMLIIGGVVSALDNLGTYKTGENIRIVQICDTATYITLSSVTYPNSTIAVSQINMTSAGSGEFYYTFTNTSTRGRHNVNGISDGCEKTFATYFEITSSGENIQQNQSLMIIGLIAIIGLFIILGFSFRVEKWKVRGFFFMCASLMGVITLNSIRIIASSSEDLGTMMETGLVLGIIVLLFLFLYFFIYALIEVFSYFRKNKQKTWDFRP